MKQYSEHIIFIYALFDKTLPKRPSSNIWMRIQKRLRNLFGTKSPSSNVESAIARASKLSVTISKSFNISQGPQLDEGKRNQLKNVIISFLNNGRRISESSSSSKPVRRKKELIRSLIRKTVDEVNKCLIDIDGSWLQGYGHIYNDGGKPGLINHFQFIHLFNEFVNCHLIPCKELNEAALSIKSVFNNSSSVSKNGSISSVRLNDRNYCDFKLSDKDKLI